MIFKIWKLKGDKCLQTLEFTGLAKNKEQISTQGLTLLTAGVILTLEQENQACTAGYFIRQWRGFV